MSWWQLTVLSLVAPALVVGCSTSSTSPTPSPVAAAPSSVAQALPAGMLATVGPTAIPQGLVVEVSQARGISVHEALDREIRDAVFANAALSRGDAESPSVRAAIRGRLARARLELLHRESAVDDLSDSEIADATAHHFVELDRPETFRVIHALVKVPDGADASVRASARALAERVALRVAPSTDADSFRSLAESTSDRGAFGLLVESLDPVAADGRTIDFAHPLAEPGQYAPSFALAAAHLSLPGQKSGVVPTEFGFHVLMLLERLPAHRVPLEERKGILRDEILNDRAKRAKKDLLLLLRQRSPVVVERSAEALLSTVQFGDNERP